MRSPVPLVLALALFATACGGSDTSTSPSPTSTTSTTSTTASDSTERFDATLQPGGSAFFSFTVGQDGGAVTINLASLTPLTRPGLLPVVMEIGYGTPIGEGCNVVKTLEAVPGLASQLTDTLAIGTYCANVADIGNLTEPANFSMRITHP
jgi:hypothetical protein